MTTEEARALVAQERSKRPWLPKVGGDMAPGSVAAFWAVRTKRAVAFDGGIAHLRADAYRMPKWGA